MSTNQNFIVKPAKKTEPRLPFTAPRGARKTKPLSLPIVPEKSIQKAIGDILRAKRILFVNPPMHKSSDLPIGFPDFYFFRRRMCDAEWVPVPVEVKKIGENPRHNQVLMHETMAENGWGHTHIVRSVDEFIELLKNYR